MSEERVWKTLRERVKSSRHSLSISDKVGILNEYRDFVAGKEVRKGIKREFLRYLTLRAFNKVSRDRRGEEQYVLKETTLRDILKNEQQLRKLYSDGQGQVLKGRKSTLALVDKALREYIFQAHMKNVPLNYDQLIGKAKAYAAELHKRGLLDSNHIEEKSYEAWKSHVKRVLGKEGIKRRCIYGETGVVDENGAQTFIEKEWPFWASLVNFDPTRIYNFVESVLLTRQTTPLAFPSKGSNAKAQKLTRERFTIGVTVSAAGELLPPLIIGKSVQPRFLRGQKMENVFHCWYYSSENSCNDTSIFQCYLKRFNDMMKQKKQHVILTLGNASIHSLEGMNKKEDLSNVYVVYLPANTMTLIQPAGMGVTRTLKSLYKSIIIAVTEDAVEMPDVPIVATKIQQAQLPLNAYLEILCDIFAGMQQDDKYKEMIAQFWRKAAMDMEFSKNMALLNEHSFDIDEDEGLTRWKNAAQHTAVNDQDLPRNPSNEVVNTMLETATRLLESRQDFKATVDKMIEDEELLPIGYVAEFFSDLDYDNPVQHIDHLCAREAQNPPVGEEHSAEVEESSGTVAERPVVNISTAIKAADTLVAYLSTLPLADYRRLGGDPVRAVQSLWKCLAGMRTNKLIDQDFSRLRNKENK